LSRARRYAKFTRNYLRHSYDCGGYMHLPQFTIDTALSLNLAPPSRTEHTSKASQQEEPFYKLLEKAMNESSAADKARDDAQASQAKEARERQQKDEPVKQEEGGKAREKKADEVKLEDNAAGKADKSGADKEASPNDEKAETAAREQNAQALALKAKEPNRLASLHRFVDREMLMSVQDASAGQESGKEQEAPARTAVDKESHAEDLLLKQVLEGAEENAVEQAAFKSERAEVPRKKEREESREPENAASLLRAGAHVEQNAAGIEDAAALANAAPIESASKDAAGFFEGGKPLFTVIDERSHEARQEKGADVFARVDGNQAEMMLSLSASAKESAAAANAAERGAESKFASMLSREIQNNASEFVKAGTIVLRDNDSGSIRLLLNPKDLGDVKILLQLTDNNIAARISVSTVEAYDAFKSSIDSLKQAFSDSGFSTGEFNLSYAGAAFNGSQSQNADGAPAGEARENSPFQYAKEIASFAAAGENDFMETDNYAVNVMA
jgi:flagellar hook-length control protein FliK